MEDLPDGILTCTVNGADGDVDLWMGIGAPPSEEFAACRSDSYSSREECNVVLHEQVGQLYALLIGVKPARNVTFLCEISTTQNTATSFTLDREVTEFSTSVDMEKGDHLLYKLNVAKGATRVQCDTIGVQENKLSLFMETNRIVSCGELYCCSASHYQLPLPCTSQKFRVAESLPGWWWT